MGIITWTTNTEGTIVFDDKTGEIYAHVGKPTQKKIPNIDKYIGIDCSYVNHCRDEQELIETISNLDGYLDTKPIINSLILAESVAQGMLTPQQLKLLLHVANNLTGWNVFFCKIKDLCNDVGIKPNNVAAVLKSLTPNLLSVMHRDTPFRGDIALKINPVLAWKGDLELKDKAVENWYAPIFKGAGIAKSLYL